MAVKERNVVEVKREFFNLRDGSIGDRGLHLVDRCQVVEIKVEREEGHIREKKVGYIGDPLLVKYTPVLHGEERICNEDQQK